MDISRSLLSQVGGWELRSGGCRQGSSRATTAIYHAGMLSRVCLATGRWREADFPLGVALSAQCGRNVERAPREGGQRRSLQSCARDRYQHAPKPGGVSRHVASRPRPHLRRGFSLISRAWRALLTSCLAHHRVGLAEPCSRWDNLARSEPLGVVTGDERSRQSSSGEFVQEPHDRGVRIRGGAPGAKG